MTVNQVTLVYHNHRPQSCQFQLVLLMEFKNHLKLYAMFDQKKLLEIISGQRKGLIASVVRMGLGCLTPFYRFVISSRNRKFDESVNNPEIVKRAGIPVISVGNLTTGGTGKTPMVIWISNWLRKQNIRVVLISRGYMANQNSATTGGNDEAIELENRLPDVPHLQDPDRFAMSQIAVNELESQLIVLDDGFQHRKLWRDLDIVLIDATEPFGYGRLLPRGILREPISSLSRANIAVITRSDQVANKELDSIRIRISTVNKDLPVAMAKTVFTNLLQSDGTELPISNLESLSSVFVFCAIGNPNNFRNTIEKSVAKVIGFRSFRDHHEFSREDLEQIGQEANNFGAKAIVCTHKDLVKVGVNRIAGIPVFAVLIDIEMVDGEELLTQELSRITDSIKVTTND